MIDPKELRIGNWVCFQEEDERLCFQVLNIHPEHINEELIHPEIDSADGALESYTRTVEREQIHGIPLTPELLEKCGFRDIMQAPSMRGPGPVSYILRVEPIYFDAWTNGGGVYHIEASADADGAPIVHMKPIESLHHFQNFYYFTTGKELEVSL